MIEYQQRERDRGIDHMFTYTTNEQLVRELKQLMKDEKISQQDIAAKLGVTRQGVRSLLIKKNFSFKDAQKILELMNYSLEISFKKNI